ncbi:MAG TPA: NAD(P)-binding protein [Actinomycetes bacterium]|nr:NAD(P)-binding protein [Actinomycetes bacterium]
MKKGLSAAALLATGGGKRVLVLQRHYAVGGFTQGFHRPGYEWDVGVHYVADVQPGTPIRALFDEITDGRLDWQDMGPVYGLRHTAEQLGLKRPNLWIYPDEQHERNLAAALDDLEAAPPFAYMSFPSAKDPEFGRRHPGRATIQAMTVAPYEAFARWENADGDVVASNARRSKSGLRSAFWRSSTGTCRRCEARSTTTSCRLRSAVLREATLVPSMSTA